MFNRNKFITIHILCNIILRLTIKISIIIFLPIHLTLLLSQEISLRDKYIKTFFNCNGRCTKELVSIIDDGFDPNTLIIKDMSPLWFASKYSNIELFVELINHGANINDGTLNYIVAKDKVEFLKILLERKVDLNKITTDLKTPSQYGQTALMSASQHGSINSLKLLIKNGADVNIKNSDGYNSILFAVIFSSSNIQIPIEAQSSLRSNESKNFCIKSRKYIDKSKTYKIVKLLLDNGSDIKSKDKYGNS